MVGQWEWFTLPMGLRASMRPSLQLALHGSTVNIAGPVSALTGLTTNEPPDPRGSDYGQIQPLSHRGNTGNSEDISMAQRLDSKDVVEFKELLMANTIQIDTMYQLLIQKGFFTEAEYLTKMTEISVNY